MKRWSVGDEVKVFGCESNGTPKLYGRGQIIEILPPLTRHACERYKVRITHLRENDRRWISVRKRQRIVTPGLLEHFFEADALWERRRLPGKLEPATTTVTASSGLTADAMTVPAARTVHGARRGRSKLQFAAIALQAHTRDYGDPRGVPARTLEQRVNDWLPTNSEWRTAGYDRVSIDTIQRAMKKL